MNAWKNHSIRVSIIWAITLACIPNSYAADNSFSGEWEYVEYVPGSAKPYSTFDIKLTQSRDGTIHGAYCFITQNGNRIDCDPDGVANNIIGHLTEDSRKAQVRFYSFFGAKGGEAELMRTDNNLIWNVKKNPVGDFFYGPYRVNLIKKPENMHQGEREVIVDKTYLYESPSQPSNSSTYIVKGDYVKPLHVSNNFKFWKIQYREKSGELIERWIDCNAINFCP
jgi:hypothetical protein